VCGHTPDVVIYSKFQRNLFRRFSATRGRNLVIPIYNWVIPIPLAIGFYNSLECRVQAVTSACQTDGQTDGIAMLISLARRRCAMVIRDRNSKTAKSARATDALVSNFELYELRVCLLPA